MALRYGDPAPWAYWRWWLVRETGWTLEYIDQLSHTDFMEYYQVLDGTAKAGEQQTIGQAWHQK